MIYGDFIEYNIVGDTKTPLLRCILFISEVKNGEEISFHSIKRELRDTAGEKNPFVSVGITLLFFTRNVCSKLS